MAFTIPTFNIKVNIWRNGGVGGTYLIPDLSPFGNLTPGRRVMQGQAVVDPGNAGSLGVMELLLPALTDIRAAWNGGVADLVECPIGTKRFYLVVWVDDIGKGFANEHRIAWMYYQTLGNATLIGGPYIAPKPMP